MIAAVGAAGLAVVAAALLERVSAWERTASLLDGLAGDVVARESCPQSRRLPFGALVPVDPQPAIMSRISPVAASAGVVRLVVMTTTLAAPY